MMKKATPSAGSATVRPQRGPLHVCAFGMGGSVGETLGCLVEPLRALNAGTRLTLIDMQPFHLRNPGRMTPPPGVDIERLTPSQVGYRTVLRSMSLNMLLSGGPLAYRRMVDVLTRRLESLAPDVVLCCHDRFYIETACLKAARNLDIPSVLLQEGPFCVVGHGAALHTKLRVKYGLAPLVTRSGLLPAMPDYGTAGHDQILAASEAYREAWVRHGVPRERIRITGIPRYDILASARHSRAASHTASGAPAATVPPEVMVLLQPFGAHGKVDPAAAESAEARLAESINAVGRERPITLRVRQHPRAAPDAARSFANRLNVRHSIEGAEQPFSQRAQSLDLVLGFYSSALLEAVAIGVPTACFSLPRESFAEAGEADKQDRMLELGVQVVTDPMAMTQTITELLQSSELMPDPDSAYPEIGPVDGGAAGRVARALADVSAVTPDASGVARGSVQR